MAYDFYRLVGIGYATFDSGDPEFQEPEEVDLPVLYQDEQFLVKEDAHNNLHVWYVEGVSEEDFERVNEVLQASS